MQRSTEVVGELVCVRHEFRYGQTKAARQTGAMRSAWTRNYRNQAMVELADEQRAHIAH